MENVIAETEATRLSVRDRVSRLNLNVWMVWPVSL